MLILIFFIAPLATLTCAMDCPQMTPKKMPFKYSSRADSSSFIEMGKMYSAWEKKEEFQTTPEKLNTLGCDGQAVIHHAIYNRKSGKFIEHLIRAGADVNVSSQSKDSPLHLAYCKNHTEAILVLERHKAVRFLQS